MQTIRYRNEVLALVNAAGNQPAELVLRVYSSINTAKAMNRGDVDHTCKTEKEYHELRRKLMYDHKIKTLPAQNVVGVTRNDLRWGISLKVSPPKRHIRWVSAEKAG